MSDKKLVIEGRERSVDDTVKVETAHGEIELPALEGRLIFKAFADEFMEYLDAEYRDKGEKMNATALMLQNNPLLDDEEQEEVLAQNKEYSGQNEAFEEAGVLLYKALTKFFKEKEDEVFVDE